MEREGFVFYESFYLAGGHLADSEKLLYYDRVLSYGIKGLDNPSGNPIIESLFCLIKPQIDANNKRFLDGQKGASYGIKGGRPKKNNPSGVSINNPSGVKVITPKEKEKVNDKDKDNTILHEYFSNPEKKDTFVWQWLDYCFKLGYTPAKDETVESLDEFLGKVFKDNKVNLDTQSGFESGKSAMYRWYTHWKEDGSKILNFKSKFANTIQYSIK